MHDIETLHEICETLMQELNDANDKIRNAGGELNSGDVEYLDKLTHALKSVKTTIAMLEADDGYSGRYSPRYYGEDGQSNEGGNTGMSNRGGQSNRGRNSYARGRGRNAKRDSMGRYSREGGYSYAEEVDNTINQMREMMEGLPEEKRRKIMSELES